MLRTVTIGLALTVIPAKRKYTFLRILRKHRQTRIFIHFFKWITMIAFHSEGNWGVMIAWVNVGHLRVIIGHLRATVGHLRVIKGHLRVSN